MIDKLLPYQVEHYHNLTSILLKDKVAIDASDMGVGKTYLYVAVFKSLGLKPLIVCPKVSISSVLEVCDYFRFTPLDVINWEKLRTGNHGYVNKERSGRGWRYRFHDNVKSVIFDEAHMAKNPTSLNCKMVMGARDSNLTRLLASGTLFETPLDMMAVGYSLGMFDRSGFYSWLFRNGCRKGRFGLEYRGGDGMMAKIGQDIFPKHGIRISKASIKEYFPNTTITANLYNADDVRDTINNVYYQCRERLKELRILSSHPNAAVALQKEFQYIELLSADLMISLCKEHMDRGFSVAMFVNYRETALAIQKGLATDSIVIGEQDSSERDRVIKNFREDRCHNIVLTAGAGGQSISLHNTNGGRERVSLIRPVWSAVTLSQIFGRVHRSMGTDSYQKIVFIAGTCEESCYRSVCRKTDRISAFNDGDILSNMFEDIQKIKGR